MIEEYLYLKAGGLELKPRPKEYFDDGLYRDNENHILFLCEYVFLHNVKSAYIYKELEGEYLKPFFVRAKKLLQVEGYPGLYHRGHGLLKFHEVTKEVVGLSHDNLTAFACLNYFYYSECDEIINHLKKHNYTIDNAQPEKPRLSRILHPRDIIFLNYLNKTWWSYLCLPILTMASLLSCSTKWVSRPTFYQKVWNYFFKTGLSAPYRDIATSGKCLWFIRLYATRERHWSKVTMWLCLKAMKLTTGMDFIDAIRLYFVQRTKHYHPIIELCDEIKKKGLG